MPQARSVTAVAVRKVSKSLLLRMFQNYGWQEWVREVIGGNMLTDHDAAEVRITTDAKKRLVQIDVDQLPMTKRQLECYLCRLGDSTSAGDPGKIGEHGQGERAAIFGLAGEMVLTVVSNGRADEYKVQRENWLEYLLDENAAHDPAIFRSRQQYICKDFPFATGRRVQMCSLEKNVRIPSDERLHAMLLGQLPAHLVSRVVLNGKRVLKPRARGITREFEEQNYPGLGPVRVQIIALDAQSIDGTETLSIGIQSPIMTIRDFIRHLYDLNETLYIEVPDGLRRIDPRIAGSIIIPALKPYKTQGHNRLAEGFYGSKEAKAVVNLLKSTVARMVADLVRERRTIEANDDRAQMLTRVLSLCNAAEGATPSRAPGLGFGETLDPWIAPLHRKVECGDYADFVIMGLSPLADVQWNSQDSGGTIDVLSGPKVRFTAGEEPGAYRLMATVLTPDRDAVVVTANIQILKDQGVGESPRRMNFCARPSTLHLAPQESHEIRLRNLNLTSGDVEWTMLPDHLATLTTVPGGHIAILQAGEVEGTLTVRITDRHNSTIQSTCEVIIANPMDVHRTGGGKTGGLGGDGDHATPLSDSVLRIDGEEYGVTWGSNPGSELPALVCGTVIMLEVDHPLFLSAVRPDGYINAIQSALAMAIAQARTGQSSGTEFYRCWNRIIRYWANAGIKK